MEDFSGAAGESQHSGLGSNARYQPQATARNTTIAVALMVATGAVVTFDLYLFAASAIR